MSSDLLDIIRQRIRENGPMTMEDYMGLCLGHPQHGYYMTRDPFGAKGDFITAPEISQMFGEMIGVWLADAWQKLGSPDPFVLVECGPGRGTLMSDALRATAQVSGFHKALHLYLLEMSPVLKQIQSETLKLYRPVWIEDIEHLPIAFPVLVVANEFLDALPIRQIQKIDGQWFERCVGVSDDGKLCLVFKKHNSEKQLGYKNKEKEFHEFSPILNQFLKNIVFKISNQKGAALFLDYGYACGGGSDTLQAIRKHRFENVFETPGLADVTAHIDFDNIRGISEKGRIVTVGPYGQGQFLKNLGIEIRAERLKENTNPEQRADINSAYDRLVGADQMGELFKVIGLCHDPKIKLAGFHEGVSRQNF